MILVNRNFGNPVLAEVIGDMFKSSTDVGQNVSDLPSMDKFGNNSMLVSSYTGRLGKTELNYQANEDDIEAEQMRKFYDNYNTTCNNFYLVTEHFLKTLDKVYTKIWNESFTETGIYVPANLATMYHGFAINGELNASNTDFMIFKKFVDRCITAGILDEADRLQYEDQIFLSGMSRADLSTQINLDNKLITFTASNPIDIKPDLNGLNGQYLAGKKLFLMVTPYLTNESVTKGFVNITQEPFQNKVMTQHAVYQIGILTTLTPQSVKQPIAFFKPKTDASKFGRSLPLATHLIWSIGTPDDKELALLEGKPVPDLIFDHLDRISHIDSLTLKIKFDKLSF